MKFGIKEAQKAGVFAKTREQKETVLAVVSMMGIPIVLAKQVDKKAKKLNIKIDYENSIVAKLNKKVAKSQAHVKGYSLDKEVVVATSVEWSV